MRRKTWIKEKAESEVTKIKNPNKLQIKNSKQKISSKQLINGDKMDVQYIIGELKRNKLVFKDLLEHLNADLIFWKQNERKWCLLEIVCHLCDEEREDFRARVKKTLEEPGKELDKIDPAGWVASRKYIKQDYSDKLNEFLAERDNLIKYLESLENPKWDNFYTHPKFGKMSAELFITNWLAHDYLHIKQIIRLKYDYLDIMTNEKLNYAGDWI